MLHAIKIHKFKATGYYVLTMFDGRYACWLYVALFIHVGCKVAAFTWFNVLYIFTVLCTSPGLLAGIILGLCQ